MRIPAVVLLLTGGVTTVADVEGPLVLAMIDITFAFAFARHPRRRARLVPLAFALTVLAFTAPKRIAFDIDISPMGV